MKNPAGSPPVRKSGRFVTASSMLFLDLVSYLSLAVICGATCLSGGELLNPEKGKGATWTLVNVRSRVHGPGSSSNTKRI